MNYRKLLIPIYIFIAFIFLQSCSFAVGVTPLTIDLTAKPGDTVPFTIKVKSKKSEQVTIYLNQTKQESNGAFAFIDINPDSFPAAKWVSLPDQISINPDETTVVQGVIKVPLNATGGTYPMAVMVQGQEIYKQQWGVNLLLNFAIRLKLRIDRPGLRPSTQITDFDIIKGNNGEPEVRVLAKNTSLLDFPTSATATLRDSQKKLIQRIDLKPKAGWDFNTLEMVIYPGSELLYYGQPTEALRPGQYELRLFYQYGSAGQITKSKIIEVRAGDYVYPASKLKAVRVTPTGLDFAGKPGTTALKALKFENKSDKPVDITLQLADIFSNYAYSILANTDIEINGDKQFRLEPLHMSTDIVNVKFRKDSLAQVNYGMVKVKVYSTEPDHNLLEDFTIPLSAAVTGSYTYTAEVTNLLGEANGDKFLLSAMIKNTGNIKITPGATAFIKNAQGQLADTVNLTVEGDDNAFVYPDKALTLTGFAQNLAPGKYSIQIKMKDGNRDLGASDLSLEVK